MTATRPLRGVNSFKLISLVPGEICCIAFLDRHKSVDGSSKRKLQHQMLPAVVQESPQVHASRCYLQPSRCYWQPSRCYLQPSRCYLQPSRCYLQLEHVVAQVVDGPLRSISHQELHQHERLREQKGGGGEEGMDGGNKRTSELTHCQQLQGCHERCQDGELQER